MIEQLKEIMSEESESSDNNGTNSSESVYNIIGNNTNTNTNIKNLQNQKSQKKNENNEKKQNKKRVQDDEKYLYNFNNKYINIETHNVQGFNVESKQWEFFEEYKDNEIDIIGLTETKLSSKKSRYIMTNNKYYKSWWTGLENSNNTGGVGIAIRRGLHLHVVNVISKMGRLILIDLCFKGTEKMRIINVYINSNETEKIQREELVNISQNLIQEAKRHNFRIIIMGI